MGKCCSKPTETSDARHPTANTDNSKHIREPTTTQRSCNDLLQPATKKRGPPVAPKTRRVGVGSQAAVSRSSRLQQCIDSG